MSAYETLLTNDTIDHTNASHVIAHASSMYIELEDKRTRLDAAKGAQALLFKKLSTKSAVDVGELNDLKVEKGKVDGELNDLKVEKGKVDGELNDLKTAKGKVDGELNDLKTAKGKVDGELSKLREEMRELESQIQQALSMSTNVISPKSSSAKSSLSNIVKYNTGDMIAALLSVEKDCDENVLKILDIDVLCDLCDERGISVEKK